MWAHYSVAMWLCLARLVIAASCLAIASAQYSVQAWAGDSTATLNYETGFHIREGVCSVTMDANQLFPWWCRSPTLVAASLWDEGGFASLSVTLRRVAVWRQSVAGRCPGRAAVAVELACPAHYRYAPLHDRDHVPQHEYIQHNTAGSEYYPFK